MTGIAVGVCGFPRSGSSMTMQMLEAGGVPPIIGSSPGGYEIGLHQLDRMAPSLFAGHAIKLLDYPLSFGGELPAGLEWRFIWLDRDPRQQALSNVKLMTTLMPSLPKPDPMRFARSFREERPKLLAWFRRRGDVLVVSFEEILADPAAAAARMAAHIPGLDAAAAAAVPEERPPACAPDLSNELSKL